jgi:antitoxin (DNA-binding transcriptional repressor) of toxin-antitoxin stability system
MAVLLFMSTYSVAEAKNHLPQLIDRALSGEDVVIARHGNPLVEQRPIRSAGRPVTAADVEWLKGRRVGNITPPVDAGMEISRMRDEEAGRLDRLSGR